MRTSAIAILLLSALVCVGCGSKEESGPDFDALDDAEEADGGTSRGARVVPGAELADPVTGEPMPTVPAKPEAPAEDPVVKKPRMTYEDSPVQTPVDYIETVVRLGAHQQYRVKIATVQGAIGQYKALKQAFPGSVEDLVKEGLLVKVPSLKEGHYWKIDGNTGEVTIREKTARRR